jgi:hypothetical protein
VSSRVFPTMRTSTDVRARRSGGGGDRDGRLRIAALTNVRAVVRVLGSASLRADAVDRRRAPFRVGSIWGNMFRSMTSRPSRQSADLLTANARVCTSRMPCALTAILLPESRAHGCHMLQTWFPEWTRLGCARGAGPGAAEAAAGLAGIRCEGRGNFD